jgi:hypothetical protein
MTHNTSTNDTSMTEYVLCPHVTENFLTIQVVTPQVTLKEEVDRMDSDRHKPDNITITIRARSDWIARLDAAAQAAGESRMAYIRRAVEERMARERRDDA